MSLSLPQSGGDYLESLHDGRSIAYHGGLVDDVTTHPAFRGAAHSIADLYDALRADASAAVAGGESTLTAPTESGDGLTHAFYAIPRSRDDLRRQRDAIRAWQRRTHGWMGRTPEFMGSVWTSIGSVPEFFGEHEQAARTWFARAQRDVPHFAHALVHPPVDRMLGPDAVRDVFVHVERETDAGLVVSGAKVVATGAGTAQHVLVAHFGGDVESRDLALVFVAPMHAKGLRVYARQSYEHAASRGPAADYPLSSRFDENDAIIVFDEVLIPWDDVLVHDVDRMREFNTGAVGWSPRLAFQASTRLEVKLEGIIGLVSRALDITGSGDFRGVRAQLGELIAFRHQVAGLRDAMIESAVPGPGGSILPNPSVALAFAAMAPGHYGRMRQIIETIVASGLIHLNSSVADFAVPEFERDLDRYLRGTGGISARERVGTMKALWDAVGSEFGARHELYELNYWGQPEKSYLGILGMAERSGDLEAWRDDASSIIGEAGD